MWRRGGGGAGGGADNGGNAAAARQLLLSILGEAAAVRGLPARRSMDKGKGKGKQGSGLRQREGEWSCQCGFPTNRPHRMACYNCGRSRDVAEVGHLAQAPGAGDRQAAGGKGQADARFYVVGGGNRDSRGPVGADGRRPLLGGRGRNPLEGPAGMGHGKGHAKAQVWAGKGPRGDAPMGKAMGPAGGAQDLGAKGGTKGCKASGTRAPPPGEDGGPRRAWARPPTIVDDDGYELVQPRRIRTEKGGQKGGDAAGVPVLGGGEDGDAATQGGRRLWSDEDSDDGGCADGDAWECNQEERDDGVHGGQGPDPRQLRADYEEYARAVKQLEKQGAYGPAIDTLRQARDAAEGVWRQAKAPAPLPRRLEWAETKLRRAQSALTRARLDLDHFDSETDRQRTDLLERIQTAESWYKWRQLQPNELHDEAADRVPGRRGEEGVADRAGEIREKLRGHVLPEMQAILEDVQEGTAVHQRLTLLVAGLADAEARLGMHQEEDGPAHYEMYDDDSQYGEGQDGHLSTTDEMEEEGTQGKGTGDDHGDVRHAHATGWKPEGPSRWTRADAPRREARTSVHGAAAATGGRPNRRDAGEDLEQGGAGTRPTGDEGGERAGKHRRRQTEEETAEDARAAEDARRAEELHRQLQIASAAQERSYREGSGGFGSEAALSTAAQRFVLEVQRAQAQAHEQGVEPCADDGRSLLELSPAELRQWMEEHLEGGGRD